MLHGRSSGFRDRPGRHQLIGRPAQYGLQHRKVGGVVIERDHRHAVRFELFGYQRILLTRRRLIDPGHDERKF